MDDEIQETFDVPCIKGLTVEEQKSNTKQQELEKQAEDFLREEAAKFGAEIKKRYNPHDFGSYPSFELIVTDVPHDVDDCLDCSEGTECAEYNKDPKNEKYDALWDNINGLHKKYYAKFEAYL